ncbi:two-component regulator propeller domain-containing protein [uncultured Clostridium sp.]|uniref:ligand-binding sensor domain-containing protein n=1 Tax=uncultured Clostridium sp. TaxID=59620 RepID=UPI0025E91D48|nr:two-component regulator propeller domain-containing protein [uncultured Clostridium sp.]
MYQDSREYIWLATNDGLNRYNGYEFKHYKNDKYDKNTLSNNYVIDITEDGEGYIWISTLEGASRLNPNTDEFKNYFSGENKGNLSNNRLNKMLSTKDNKIYAATIDGLNVYNKEADKFYRVLDGENELPSQYIYFIKEDSRGHIWIGTDNGLVECDKDLNVIKLYNDEIEARDIYNIYDDSKGNIWVCTLRGGLYRINLDDKSIKHYKSSDNKNSISSDTVKDAVIDSKGKLWLATDNGICSFDYEKEVFTRYKKEPYESDSLVDDNTRCLLKDKSGIIFVGTYRGISIFNPVKSFYHFKARPSYENSLSGNSINGIYKDSNDTLWIGTSEDGVNIIDGDYIQHLNTSNSNLIGDKIHDITGKDNRVFIGTNDGLSVVQRNSDKSLTITNYTEENGLPSNKIRSLFVDSKGNLLIGTNKGISILNIETGELEDISNMFDKINVSDKFVRAIYEDSKGNYYIGCFLEGGLIKIDPKTDEVKIYRNIENDDESISNNTIRYITEDLNGNILIGTSHGINILDSETDKFKHFTESDGLINNTIYGILVDKSGDIWMSTNGGMSKLSLKDNSIKNFTVVDGLQSNEFNGRACFASDDGKLYFGGINGYNVIDIDNLELSAFKPQVILEAFEVNGLERSYISDMRLKHNQNNVKIKFFSNDYKNAEHNKLYYRFKGEEKWNITDNNSILLANLASGKYDFEIATISQQGIMSEINTISFAVKSHPLLSKFSIMCYIIMIYLFFYGARNKVKALDSLVNIRTSELRNEMEKNKELFNKFIKLEQSKNNYFVNLSHELRTPLNILSSINQLIESFAKSDTGIPKEKVVYYMGIMDRNCKRLLNLINNLIDYSKMENESYVITKKTTDIIYLVEETVLDMKDYIEEKGIELIFDTDVEEKSIECDKVDIERCVFNLLSNAAKFTPEGGLIEVIVYDLYDKVQISVKDTGVGISEENLKIIFDRFNQVIDKDSEQKGGSGLGLTITKQIIELHGGEIQVKSKVNEGSEFIIILPVK